MKILCYDMGGTDIKYGVIENDIILDQYIWFEGMYGDEYFQINGMLKNIDELDLELDYGRMPELENEVVIYVDKNDYYFSDRLEDAIKANYYLEGNKFDISIKVVGVKYQDNKAFNYENNMSSILTISNDKIRFDNHVYKLIEGSYVGTLQVETKIVDTELKNVPRTRTVLCERHRNGC